MKKIDWFKFTATDWLSGSIQLLSDAEKGTYIDLVALIWKEGGVVQFDKILSRKLRLDYATACDRIDSYCELNILVCENDNLSIKFLSEQLDSIHETSQKNSENAAKRWQKKKESMRPHANKKRKEEKRKEKKREDIEEIKEDKEKELFDCFRVLYPGTKRGLNTEFDNFKKKHKDWKEIVGDLKPLLQCQINIREAAIQNGVDFLPQWKNLATWINNRCWEDELNFATTKTVNVEKAEGFE